jgi:isopentenyl-diphosphate Delta-isomerase
MSEELVLEVNFDDEPIKLRPRKDFYKYNIIFRSSALILFNDDGKILLQKRSKSKKWFPGLYDFSVSGVVNGRESYEECMTRETKEEIGIKLDFNFLFKLTPSEKKDRSFHSVFIASTNQKLYPDINEIELIKWISREKLKKDIVKNSKKFTPQLLFGLKKYFNYIDNK